MPIPIWEGGPYPILRADCSKDSEAYRSLQNHCGPNNPWSLGTASTFASQAWVAVREPWSSPPSARNWMTWKRRRPWLLIRSFEVGQFLIDATYQALNLEIQRCFYGLSWWLEASNDSSLQTSVSFEPEWKWMCLKLRDFRLGYF